MDTDVSHEVERRLSRIEEHVGLTDEDEDKPGEGPKEEEDAEEEAD